jgi:type VI protein secretion system component VasK
MNHGYVEGNGGAASAGTNWVTVGITAAGVLLGVVVTVLGSLYVANKRITELEITHAQKLQEVFLSNARDYLEAVYLPLHLAQARLASGYRQFQLRDASADVPTSESEARWAEAIGEYLSLVDQLMDRAAGAFLSPQLEDEIEDLSSFLRTSLTAEAVKRRITFTLRLYGTSMSRVVESTAKVWPTNISLMGVGSSVELTKVLAAPLSSQEFEEQFVIATARVRRLIKEVTLGAHTRTRA